MRYSDSLINISEDTRDQDQAFTGKLDSIRGGWNLRMQSLPSIMPRTNLQEQRSPRNEPSNRFVQQCQTQRQLNRHPENMAQRSQRLLIHLIDANRPPNSKKSHQIRVRLPPVSPQRLRQQQELDQMSPIQPRAQALQRNYRPANSLSYNKPGNQYELNRQSRVHRTQPALEIAQQIQNPHFESQNRQFEKQYRVIQDTSSQRQLIQRKWNDIANNLFRRPTRNTPPLIRRWATQVQTPSVARRLKPRKRNPKNSFCL